MAPSLKNAARDAREVDRQRPREQHGAERGEPPTPDRRRRVETPTAGGGRGHPRLARQEPEVRAAARPRAGSRATSRAASRTAAPSCARTRRCRSARRSLRAPAASVGGQVRLLDQLARPPAPAPPASRLGTTSASWPIGQDVEQAVGIGRDDRLARRQRLERRQRRAFPERRKHDDVERRQHLRRRRAGSRRRRSRSPRPRARACASSSACSSPSPTMNTRARGCRSTISGTASTRYWLPFDGISRVTVPTAIVSGAMPSDARAAAISSAIAAARTRRAASRDRRPWSARPASAARES